VTGAVEVHLVPASATYPLRQRVLRPHQGLAEMPFPGDDGADAGHFAAVADGVVVGTASVLREAPPWAPGAPDSWRLRGMATEENRRSQGVGTFLVAAVIGHTRDRGGRLLWCNARLPAMEFYRRAGFATRGESWVEPCIGPHIAMARTV
jgi:GNAT superfamily N-acetyltransferase